MIDMCPPRFNTEEEAVTFLRAVEVNRFANPGEYGAVPPYRLEDGKSVLSPEYKNAKYQFELWLCGEIRNAQ